MSSTNFAFVNTCPYLLYYKFMQLFAGNESHLYHFQKTPCHCAKQLVNTGSVGCLTQGHTWGSWAKVYGGSSQYMYWKSGIIANLTAAALTAAIHFVADTSQGLAGTFRQASLAERCFICPGGGGPASYVHMWLCPQR